MTGRLLATLLLVLTTWSLVGCQDDSVRADRPAPHMPVRVLVLPFQSPQTNDRLYDADTNLEEVKGHLRVALFRIGITETLESIDGFSRVSLAGRPNWDGFDGFAPEAAGLLGAGISTHHRWFGSEPLSPTTSGPEEDVADLVVRGSPVTVGDRALVRLRLADGQDRILDDFFVDVHDAGEGVSPGEAMHRIGNAATTASGVSGPARIAGWLPTALDAVDYSTGDLLRAVVMWPRVLAPWYERTRRSRPGALPQARQLDRLLQAVTNQAPDSVMASLYAALTPWVWFQLHDSLYAIMMYGDDDQRAEWITRLARPYGLPAHPDSLARHIVEQLDAASAEPELGADLNRLSVDLERRVRGSMTDDPRELMRLALDILEARPADRNVWAALGAGSIRLECWGGAYLLSRWVDPWVGGSDVHYLLRLGDFPAPERLDRARGRVDEGTVPSRYLRDAPRPIQQRFARPHVPRTVAPHAHRRVAAQGYPHDLEVRAAWLRYRVASDPGGIDRGVQKIRGEYEDVLRGIGFPADPSRFADPDAPTHAEIQGLLAEYETGVRELPFLPGGLVTAYQTQALAGIAAMRGDHEEALIRLESVHRSGLLPLADLEHDLAFMDLRHHPRFQAMIDDRYQLLDAERRLWDRFQDTPPSAAVLQEVGETCLESVEAFGGSRPLPDE